MRTGCVALLATLVAHPSISGAGAQAPQLGKDPPWLTLVKQAKEDYDRFINNLLEVDRADPEAFEKAAEAGQTLNQLLFHATSHSLGADQADSLFRDFRAYVTSRKPVSVRGVVKSTDIPRDECCLARCSSLAADEFIASIVLSQGNVEVAGHCSGSLIISGGDVNCKKRMIGCIILSAGDVALNTGGGIASSNALIIAGGTITINAAGSRLVLVSPNKVQLGPRAELGKNCVLIHGSAKPKDFFKFPSFATYGLAARLEKGQIQIGNTAPGSLVERCFQPGDRVLKRKDDKLESLGQFRRLLASALQAGDFDFEVERGGQILRIQKKLKELNEGK